ncbi:MAG TPA: 16S rRNA (cytosine(1402)-N(4))-methyltransferase, partial [Elusimicrobia bacterium]|nr:16S rRNA (cytosine(1402)-N(4))-methyltransferase [Elusimicrobiota bacterium]
LEDRIVKNVFASLIAQGKCARLGKEGRNAVVACEAELARNPRARSARLRTVEKKQEEIE